MKRYTTPIPNLNGTSRSDLLMEWKSAYKHLKKARAELRVATCHPRDFQFQEQGTWAKAIDEKNTVLAYLEDAIELAEQWAIAVQE